MTEARGSGESRRYCTNCGAELRPSNAFCVSCGASLTAGAGQPGPTDAGPSLSGRSGYSSAGGFGNGLPGATGRLGGGFSGSRADDLRRVPLGAGRWFGRLPPAVKAALAVLVLLVLLTVLGPVAPVLAAVAFGASLVILVIRIAQRRSAARWGVAAAASLVLALALFGVSGVLYGGGSTAGTEAGSRGGGYAQGDRGYGESGSPPGGRAGDSGGASGGTYANPVDVYLVMNDDLLMDGYLLVNQTGEGRFFHAHNLDHHRYASGEVLADGQLYLHGDVGDLDYLEHACTYDADDPRGGEAAMQEACGFSPLEE